MVALAGRTLKGTVLEPPAEGQRTLRVLLNGSTQGAPAVLPAGLDLVLAVGDPVACELVGRRLVVRSGR